MKKLVVLTVAITTLFACKNVDKPDGFILNGTASNVEDNAVVYLNINNKITDSTVVQNEKFQFKGTVKQPTKVIISIKNTPDYAFLWLENKTMNFYGEKGNFTNAKISGSLVQKEHDELSGRLTIVKKKRDSINVLLSTSQENTDDLIK